MSCLAPRWPPIRQLIENRGHCFQNSQSSRLQRPLRAGGAGVRRTCEPELPRSTGPSAGGAEDRTGPSARFLYVRRRQRGRLGSALARPALYMSTNAPLPQARPGSGSTSVAAGSEQALGPAVHSPVLHRTALPQVTHLWGAGGARRHPQEENTRGSP